MARADTGRGEGASPAQKIIFKEIDMDIIKTLAEELSLGREQVEKTVG